MSNHTRSRRRLMALPLAAFVLAGALGAALPSQAAVDGITVKLSSKKDEAPLGAPIKVKVKVVNDNNSAKLVDLSLDIKPADGGSPTSFYRESRSVPGGGTVKVSVEVTSAQWYANKGTFKISPFVDDEKAGKPFKYEVTKAETRVPEFDDVTAAAGVSFNTPFWDCGQSMAGAAWADFDLDDDLDLYVAHPDGGASKLFINDGSGHFDDEAALRGVANNRVGLGASAADYDNDGDPDLYVVNDGVDRLYQNDGLGHFIDVTEIAGVSDDSPGSAAAWGDYDNDGNLDLYVTNLLRCSGTTGNVSLTYWPDKLYHSNGDGTFTDVTSYLGTNSDGRPSTIGAGWMAGWFDYDNDGDVDLYLGNDFIGGRPDRNRLWRNDGRKDDGTWKFTDVSVSANMFLQMNTMGIGYGDYDRDMDLDVALSNIEDNKLMRNNGNGTFTDVADNARVARPKQRVAQKGVTWGAAFYDLNLDGWEDLYLSAGALDTYTYPDPEVGSTQPNELFVNDKDGKFFDLSAPSGTDTDRTSRGVAWADYDGDGRVDMYVLNRDSGSILYRNVTSMKKRHWLAIDTVGTESNSDGCGAMLTLTVDGDKMMRQVYCGSTSVASGADPTVHFGLGKSKDASKLVIEWPSGTTQTIKNLDVDRLRTVTEP